MEYVLVLPVAAGLVWMGTNHMAASVDAGTYNPRAMERVKMEPDHDTGYDGHPGQYIPPPKMCRKKGTIPVYKAKPIKL
jgi:hypothetical protein